jgi:hypothetical protein
MVETAISVVLVALVTITAIHRYGARISSLFGQDIAVSLGAKSQARVGGITLSDPRLKPGSGDVSVGRPGGGANVKTEAQR